MPDTDCPPVLRSHRTVLREAVTDALALAAQWNECAKTRLSNAADARNAGNRMLASRCTGEAITLAECAEELRPILARALAATEAPE